jgi:hypothetical protein
MKPLDPPRNISIADTAASSIPDALPDNPARLN